MAEIYQKLQYNFDDPNGSVKDFSANSIAHLESIPSIIDDWQSQDIADDNVGGYLQNPVGNVTSNISTSASQIVSILNTGSSSDNGVVYYVTTDVIGNSALYGSAVAANISNTLQSIIAVSSNLANQSSDAVNGFKAHTDRISGLTNYNDYIDDTAAMQKPFYATAMGHAKVAVYILYQTDGISNSSTVMGSFTSLLIKPQLDAMYNTMSGYANTINSSITVTSSGTGSSGDPYTTTRTSNLSLSVVTEMYNNLSNTNSYMNTRRTHDETFYTNLKNLVTNYHTTRQFNQMGESQLDLINNHTGTEKLLSRIN